MVESLKASLTFFLERNLALIISIGQFQKISIHHDGRLFGIASARGGSLNWNSEGMGEY